MVIMFPLNGGPRRVDDERRQRDERDRRTEPPPIGPHGGKDAWGGLPKERQLVDGHVYAEFLSLDLGSVSLYPLLAVFATPRTACIQLEHTSDGV
jgi:hypothetical protein